MTHQKRIPLGVTLLNPSTFLLQCRLCGQQWSPQIEPGGAIGYKRKLCPNGCTQQISALREAAHEIDFDVEIQDEAFFFSGGYIGATASFPLTPAGVAAAFEWLDTQAEEHYEV